MTGLSSITEGVYDCWLTSFSNILYFYEKKKIFSKLISNKVNIFILLILVHTCI